MADFSQSLMEELRDVSQVETSLLNEAKERAKNLDNRFEKSMIGQNGESIAIKENGEISLASSLLSQYKLTKTGYASEISIQSNTITNRKNIEADEIVINKHKMNPALYELSDMRKTNINKDTAIGNLTMFSTVLVKAWEPTLKKWVLIRRLARMPLFSPILNLSDAPEELSIDTNISDEILKMSRRD